MSRPVRVLRVIARMNVGGPALQVVALADGLGPPEVEQRLLIGDVSPGEADYLQLRAPHVAATRVRGLGRSVRALDDARALVHIVREIRRFRPDIVHTHTAKAGVLGRVAALLCRVPVVVHTFHGHLLHGYFSPIVTRAVVLVERALAWRTTALVAVGTRVRDDLVAAGIGRADRYTVVPPGVAVERVDRDGARAALGLGPDAPVVAFVARLTAIKRPDRFLEVVRRVRAARPDVEVVVAGEGELLSTLQRDAADLDPPIRFLGWRGDVETVYGAADVALLTSDNEGMPVSLIEAAAAGCPAVTTDVGSAREVVLDGVTGHVRPPDPVALADAVIDLLDDDEGRRAMSAAAADHARSCFGRQRLVDDIAGLYQRLVRERGLDVA